MQGSEKGSPSFYGRRKSVYTEYNALYPRAVS